jgi:hypothetical protein
LEGGEGHKGLLGFERASHLLDRCSTVWAIPPALFALVILEVRAHFLPRQTWTTILLFAYHLTWMTGVWHHTQHFSFEMGSWEYFFTKAGLDCDPILCLPLWLDDRCALPTPSYRFKWGRGVSQTPFPDWLQTSILPIFLSPVTRITNWSHQCPASQFSFYSFFPPDSYCIQSQLVFCATSMFKIQS